MNDFIKETLHTGILHLNKDVLPKRCVHKNLNHTVNAFKELII